VWIVPRTRPGISASRGVTRVEEAMRGEGGQGGRAVACGPGHLRAAGSSYTSCTERMSEFNELLECITVSVTLMIWWAATTHSQRPAGCARWSHGATKQPRTRCKRQEQAKLELESSLLYCNVALARLARCLPRFLQHACAPRPRPPGPPPKQASRGRSERATQESQLKSANWNNCQRRRPVAHRRGAAGDDRATLNLQPCFSCSDENIKELEELLPLIMHSPEEHVCHALIPI
jgi:hypothetical protein